MSKLNTILAGVILAVIGLGSVPAEAQFEVAPDHFSDSVEAQAKPQFSKQDRSLSNRIAELRSELDGYQWQINQRASALEAARRLVDGSGGEGEFAAVFIDEYVQRYHELEQLKQDLVPLIRLAQDSIRQLQSQLAADRYLTHTSGKQAQQRVVVATSRTRKKQHQMVALAHR